MKKFIDILSVISVLVAVIAVGCTFLTSYQFMNINYIFNSYLPVQIALGVMMAVWGIRFWINEYGRRRYVYALISVLISLVLFYSISYVR